MLLLEAVFKYDVVVVTLKQSTVFLSGASIHVNPTDLVLLPPKLLVLPLSMEEAVD
jgi:hypothetical protein